MRLRTKVISLILVVFTGYMAVGFAIQRQIILPSFLSLEREEALKDINRCRRALDREIEHLTVQCKDWAAWDDTYQFVEDLNEEYKDVTLLIESYEAADLNLIYYFNTSRQLVWGEVYDMGGEEPTLLDTVVDDLEADGGDLTWHDGIDSVKSGIVNTRHGPMLIASLPIVTSENEGPARGALLMGRLLTPDTIGNLAEQTQVDMKIWSIHDGSLSEGDRQTLNKLDEDTQAFLADRSEEMLAAYAAYPDITGATILLLRADVPRLISTRGHIAMRYATVSIAVAGLVTMLVLLIAIQKIVIGPIWRLTKFANNVGKTGDLCSQIIMERNDEIGSLADELDRMVGQLKTSRDSLADVSRRAGMAEVASGVLHNVGNVLNSVNVSTELALGKLRKLPTTDLNQVNEMISVHRDDLGAYLTNDQKGRLIPGFLQELSKHMTEEQGQIAEELQGLASHIDHIKTIVDMQQQYSHVSGSEDVFSLNEILDDAVKINTAALDRHNVQLTCDYGQVPNMLVDKHKMLQVIVNLIGNAKYALDGMPAGQRRMVLKLELIGDRVRIMVEDCGVGIAQENLTKIFNHGFTTRDEGQGLGLHSSALAAKEMGGSLTVQSEGPGRGAVFTLELPVRTPEVSTQ
jgi:sensor domain CHASE-containing protein